MRIPASSQFTQLAQDLDTALVASSSRGGASRCSLVHRGRRTSVWIGSARRLHRAGLGHLAICAATNCYLLRLPCPSWTTIYAAGL
jgi:hypothetical protein